MLPSLSQSLAIIAVAGTTAISASPLLPFADVVKRDNWTPPAGFNVTYQSTFNA
jgi:hypothetical protein